MFDAAFEAPPNPEETGKCALIAAIERLRAEAAREPRDHEALLRAFFEIAAMIRA